MAFYQKWTKNQAAGLQPEPPAIDFLLNLHAFSLKSKDLDGTGQGSWKNAIFYTFGQKLDRTKKIIFLSKGWAKCSSRVNS